jgi:hypothetical protein
MLTAVCIPDCPSLDAGIAVRTFLSAYRRAA